MKVMTKQVKSLLSGMRATLMKDVEVTYQCMAHNVGTLVERKFIGGNILNCHFT